MINIKKKKINHILVALDDSKKAIGLLRVAADIAAALDANLMGLFVEDIELLKAAELPFFKEININTRRSRRIDRLTIEQILRGRVSEIRAEAERIFEETQIEWTLTITRGVVANEIQRAAADADLLIMARSTMSDKRLGSTARDVANMVPGKLLLIEPTAVPFTKLIIVFDGSEKSLRALETAAHLAAVQDAILTVAVTANSQTEAQELQAQALSWLQKHGIIARFDWLLNPKTRNFAELIKREGQCMLVLPDEISIITKGNLSDMLSEFKCPVFLVG